MAIFKQVFLKPATYRVGPNEYRKITGEDLQQYVANTRRMMDAGLMVPVLSEHAPPGTVEGGPVSREQFQEVQFADAIRNVGWVKDLAFNPETGEAEVYLDITNPRYAAAIREGSILFSSPELREGYTDGLGRQFGKTLAHFALTPRPRNPSQTKLREDQAGNKQFAMQFAMWDAPDFEVDEWAPVQFVVDSDMRQPRRVRGARPRVESVGRATGAVADSHRLAEEKGLGSEGTGAPGVPPNRRPRGRRGFLRGNKDKRPAGYKLPVGTAPSQRTGAPARGNINPKYGQLADDVQFDYSLNDPGMMGFPPVPPAPGGMQGYGNDNAGLDALLQQIQGQGPPAENPDVIRAPDEAKRQRSEACVQLLDQLGLSLPADSDLTTLDDSVLNALLSALKTKIKAEQEYEEEMAQEQQGMNLKEQIPMTAQMSDAQQMSDEHREGQEQKRKKAARRTRDADWSRFWQQWPQFVRRGSANRRLAAKGTQQMSDEHRAGQEQKKKAKRKLERRRDPDWSRPLPPMAVADNWSKFSMNRQRRAERQNSERKRDLGEKEAFARRFKKKGTQQMSDDLQYKLMATKERMDRSARGGLQEYINAAPIPAGLKRHLLARASSVQFSVDGQPYPSLTVAEVVQLLVAAMPPQFSDEQLLEAAHPRGQRWTDQQLGKAQRMAEEGLNGVTMTPQQFDDYYDRKFAEPDWAKLGSPKTNGSNGKTHA